MGMPPGHRIRDDQEISNKRQSEQIKVDRNVKRRVERTNFKLVDFVGLGQDAVVCKAPSAGSEKIYIIKLSFKLAEKIVPL